MMAACHAVVYVDVVRTVTQVTTIGEQLSAAIWRENGASMKPAATIAVDVAPRTRRMRRYEMREAATAAVLGCSRGKDHTGAHG
jgi:hypothetical protein